MPKIERLILRKERISLPILILLLFNIVLFITLSFLSPTFFTQRNLTSLMLRMSELAMLTIAQTLVMISGGMDLTIGSTMALSGTICGMFFSIGLPPAAAIFGGLLSGAIVGMLNGFLVVGLRIQSFIATVAMNSIVRSVVYLSLKGSVLSSFPAFYVAFGTKNFLGIPLLFILVIIFAILVHFLLRNTALGRSIFFIGTNEKCSYLSGIRVNRVRYLVFVMSGILSAIGGLMYTSRIGAIIPDAGLNSPLEVVTAVLIGGASVRGGKGSILGSLLGILAMFVLINGFSLLGMNPFWEVILLGAVLITIVAQSSKEKIVRMSRFKKRRIAKD